MMSGKMPNDVEIVVVCVECGEESEDGARGWTAFLTVDDEIATYCPECTEAWARDEDDPGRRAAAIRKAVDFVATFLAEEGEEHKREFERPQ
jgi:hypothetical protein